MNVVANLNSRICSGVEPIAAHSKELKWQERITTEIRTMWTFTFFLTLHVLAAFAKRFGISLMLHCTVTIFHTWLDSRPNSFNLDWNLLRIFPGYHKIKMHLHLYAFERVIGHQLHCHRWIAWKQETVSSLRARRTSVPPQYCKKRWLRTGCMRFYKGQSPQLSENS